MPQHPLPICVYCYKVIPPLDPTKGPSKGNHYLYCPTKNCKFLASQLTYRSCAYPGCLQPFAKNNTTQRGAPVRFCPKHRSQVSPGPENKGTILVKYRCRWCGGELPPKRPRSRSGKYRDYDWDATKNDYRFYRKPDYCNWTCKAAAWTYPDQPPPLPCTICQKPIFIATNEAQIKSMRIESWMILRDPSYAHSTCLHNRRTLEKKVFGAIEYSGFWGFSDYIFHRWLISLVRLLPQYAPHQRKAFVTRCGIEDWDTDVMDLLQICLEIKEVTPRAPYNQYDIPRQELTIEQWAILNLRHHLSSHDPEDT